MISSAPSKHPIFVVLDSAFQTQHITNQLELVKVPVILMVQSSLFVCLDIFICSDKMVPNTGENADGRE